MSIWFFGERQRLLDKAREQEQMQYDATYDLTNLGESLILVLVSGISPHLSRRIFDCYPIFSLIPLFDSTYLMDDAQRNLSASQEYQSLLGQINSIAGDVIAKSIQREHHESLNQADQVDTVPALGDIPSPGRKRAARFGQVHSASEKQPLEISPPSSSTTSLRDDVSFQKQHADLANELSGEISLRPAIKSFSNDDVRLAAYLLVRAGLLSVAEVKLSLPLNRKY